MAARAGAGGTTLYEFAMDLNPERWQGGTTSAYWPVSERYAQSVLSLHCPWVGSEADTLACSLCDGSTFQSFRAKFLADFLYTPACPLIIYQD
eukprot:3598830-Rhodomonas_salina.1